ncbi:hypothetical protein [Xanthobacter autotrophicus]|uniref:hypothetical protein n=1 Tax=Xanthobacter autotrophicus TaxID=280 RepID=UPI0024A62E7C|nr:hypothetical protein [Xanthobacter autotrophicus]MDI4658955.1 hypothetical protein [Xanthobacter autotrophicus]
MTEDDIALRVGADNGVPLTQAEARAVSAIARDLNARVAAGADQRLSLDAAPWSFATLCAEIAAEKTVRKTGPEAGE